MSHSEGYNLLHILVRSLVGKHDMCAKVGRQNLKYSDTGVKATFYRLLPLTVPTPTKVEDNTYFLYWGPALPRTLAWSNKVQRK